MIKKANVKRYGIYKRLGDYHKKINPKWPYYPLYVEKLNYVERFMLDIDKTKKILDVGCGDGTLVEKYRKCGYNIEGIDLNYSSKYVRRGNMTKMPYKNNTFDVLLCLDSFQYLEFSEQKKALGELKRITKRGSIILFAVPNLAHFASRIYFLLFGKLKPTDSKTFPKGDRTINSYLKLFSDNNLKIVKRKGLFPTYPLITLLTYLFPDKVVWMHKLYNSIFAYSNICIMNFVEVRNNKYFLQS